jgi:hypothetical protein
VLDLQGPQKKEKHNKFVSRSKRLMLRRHATFKLYGIQSADSQCLHFISENIRLNWKIMQMGVFLENWSITNKFKKA